MRAGSRQCTAQGRICILAELCWQRWGLEFSLARSTCRRNSQRGKRRQIADFVATNRIPTAGGWGEWTKDGLLLTYGPNIAEPMRRAATYVDKILKGARPGELPIERPAKFELVINLKAAKALGLTISPTLLSRADAVIE